MKTADKQRKLLDFLFANLERLLSASDIETEYFGFGPMHHNHDEGRSRGLVLALNGNLRKYEKENAAEKWICEIPNAKEEGGYHLVFTERPPPLLSPTELFWKPHLETAEDILVVCNSYLFFFDRAIERVFRFSDVNWDARKAPADVLKEKHLDAFEEGLKPDDPYLSAGEVNAHERLQRWFYEKRNVLIRRKASLDVLERDIHQMSPILLGRPGANRFIATLSDAMKARYRFDDDVFGAVRISGPLNRREEKALARFPIKEGLLGPVPQWQTVFGVVCRFPNPSGFGAVTIISADYYARVISQIASVLTDDRRAGSLLAKMEWPREKPLPESFDMLFSVGIAPGELKGEGHPELLCWHSPNVV